MGSTRLSSGFDYIGPDRFDIYWMRHKNKWHPVFQGVALKQAFELMIAFRRSIRFDSMRFNLAPDPSATTEMTR
jgi:hypothetical protein